MRSARQLIPLFLKPLEYLAVLLVAIAILAAVFGYQALVQSPALAGVIDRLSTFSTIFLGIFIEAVPFLLLGTLASGLVEVYVRQDDFKRLVPSNVLGAALFGGVMGLFFPVCECGVIPLTRRLFHKGLPTAAGIAFLLASPVVNPIVIASTMAAFGLGRVLYLRVGITLLIAVSTGLIFALQKDSNQILRPVEIPVTVQLPSEITPGTQPGQIPGRRARLQQALTITVDEFFEMGRYLVMGALLAALLQTFLPQNALETIGQGPILSVLVMMALAVLLSICSTVDAFIALSFAATFSPGAIVAFLVFGPMVDIKSIFMYLRVFRKRSVFYLVVLPFSMALLAGILINFYSF